MNGRTFSPSLRGLNYDQGVVIRLFGGRILDVELVEGVDGWLRAERVR